MEQNQNAGNPATLSIFNIGQHSEQMNDALFGAQGESNMFDVRVKNVGDSTSFIIRPVPYVENPLKSKVEKFFYAVPNGTGTVIYDSLTTFNKPEIGEYHFCPISDIWLRLNNSPDPNTKKMAERLRRQVAIFSYVQIVNCPDKPELNGKLMVMKMPIEMNKTMRNMSKLTEAQKALKKVEIQPYDIIGGANLECTITGHKPRPTDPLMRDWKVEAEKPSEMTMPYNGTWVPVSQVPEADVIAYFKEHQTTNMEERYGYKAPSGDAALAAYRWLQASVGMVPGIREQIDINFKDVLEAAKAQEVGGMADANAPVTEPKQVTFANPMETQNNTQPVAATEPAPTPELEKEQPQTTIVETPENKATEPVKVEEAAKPAETVAQPTEEAAKPAETVAQPAATQQAAEPVAQPAATQQAAETQQPNAGGGVLIP